MCELKRYVGFLMMLVGAVAIYDATIGNTPTDNAGVHGALVMFVVVPGFLLWRKPPAAKD